MNKLEMEKQIKIDWMNSSLQSLATQSNCSIDEYEEIKYQFFKKREKELKEIYG